MAKALSVPEQLGLPNLERRGKRREERLAKDPKVKMTLVPEETLREAQASFGQFLFQGKPTKCPCCGRRARIYKRKLNAGMARMLVRFYEVHFLKPGDEWVHVHDLFGGFAQAHRDWPVLKLWGLIEHKDPRTESENASGFWRLTELGRAFVRGEAKAPKHVFMYDKKRVDASTEQTTIREALGNGFDYAELMQPFNLSKGA